MKLILALSACVTLVLAARETQYESAIRARELVAFRAKNMGVLMTTFKQDDNRGAEGLLGLPMGLQEYYTSFPGHESDILLLAMPISNIFKNSLPPNNPNLTLTISDLEGLGDGNLAAGRMRVALFGSLERITDVEEVEKCREAYLLAHPDSRGWIPPTGPHSSFYARLRVSNIYAFGGFGDVAYIGWIPTPLYVASGEKMRLKDEVLKHWPEPVQPEPEFSNDQVLFGETSNSDDGAERLRIQW